MGAFASLKMCNFYFSCGIPARVWPGEITGRSWIRIPFKTFLGGGGEGGGRFLYNYLKGLCHGSAVNFVSIYHLLQQVSKIVEALHPPPLSVF